MPEFVIERAIPGASKLSGADLQAISKQSCDALMRLGPQIQWVQSYVADDKIYCVYFAREEALLPNPGGQVGFLGFDSADAAADLGDRG